MRWLALLGMAAVLATAFAGVSWWSPSARAVARLDMTQLRLDFSEDFDKPLSVSAWGPATRWIAHTPWNGDFGDARFVDPQPGFPFSVRNGLLRIEARRVVDATTQKAQWRSGLLSSNAPDGSGYSLQYGYFEMSAKLPGGPGVWPAFWLASSADRRDPRRLDSGQVEIDVLEYYGLPDRYTANVHVWKPPPYRHSYQRITFSSGLVSTGFHSYGVLVTEAFIAYYFDRAEVWRVPTPVEHKRPLLILLNLALGGGWPIDGVPSPSFMYVDYVRAYVLKPGAVFK